MLKTLLLCLGLCVGTTAQAQDPVAVTEKAFSETIAFLLSNNPRLRDSLPASADLSAAVRRIGAALGTPVGPVERAPKVEGLTDRDGETILRCAKNEPRLSGCRMYGTDRLLEADGVRWNPASGILTIGVRVGTRSRFNPDWVNSFMLEMQFSWVDGAWVEVGKRRMLVA